ncbi:MAG: hypothetical protein Q7J52_18800 [Falsiroseomonas sp.]|nr:hypothetical protein [Falsiroseomonas sp.]
MARVEQGVAALCIAINDTRREARALVKNGEWGADDLPLIEDDLFAALAPVLGNFGAGPHLAARLAALVSDPEAVPPDLGGAA